jgi:starch synthase
LLATPEAVPFAKTGGLADVTGTIPKHLRLMGHDVAVVMPLYRMARAKARDLGEPVSSFAIDVHDHRVEGRVFRSTAPDDIPFYLVECDRYFDRPQLYGTPEGDFPDNAERFTFFSRAVLELASALSERLPDGTRPAPIDVLHLHDWQTALVPVYLRTIYAGRAFARDTATLLTIHNLAYQGLFWHWDMKLTGLDWSLFTPERLEFYGKVNFLKGGIVYADAISTVSRTYGREIQTVEFGCGLEGVLRNRAADLSGILNGVDYDEWAPEHDPLIPASYGPADTAPKAASKALLQREFGLREDAATPLIGMVSRLVDQKGLDIFARALDEIMALDLEIAILGTGDERYHRLLTDLAEQYRGKLAVRLAFDNRLAHLVEAGADMFLMPSRYEPCGLNQLYSLKYGTVPIVRATGGLADTISDVSKNGEGANGFTFQEYSAQALAETVARAVACFGDKRRWKKIMSVGMAQDWSWKRSAEEYSELYARIVQKRRAHTS